MNEYIVKCKEVVGISGKTLMVPDYIDLNSEIVRCRDCKHGHKDVCERPIWDDGDRACTPIEPDGFCAWGEPKGGSE